MEFLFFIFLLVGKGSYGIVAAAKDNLAPPSKRLIAIKKIEKAFQQKLFTKRTLRELKILRLLSHDNVPPSKSYPFFIKKGDRFYNFLVFTEIKRRF